MVAVQMAKRSKQRGTTKKEGQKSSFKLTGASFMVILIIVLMVGSSVAFIILYYSSGSSSQTYNGVSFSVDKQLNSYVFTYDGAKNYAWYLPPDVASVNVPQAFISALDNTSRVTIARSARNDSALAVGTYYLADSLTTTGRFAVSSAFTDRVPAVNCSYATASNPMILFASSNTSNLTYSDYCLRVDYVGQQDLLRERDAIAYHALGILG